MMNDVDTMYAIDYGECEARGAFEDRGAEGQELYLECDPKRPRTQTTVRLYNDDESIELLKIDSEDW